MGLSNYEMIKSLDYGLWFLQTILLNIVCNLQNVNPLVKQYSLTATETVHYPKQHRQNIYCNEINFSM
jgi:hypothetical protein